MLQQQIEEFVKKHMFEKVQNVHSELMRRFASEVHSVQIQQNVNLHLEGKTKQVKTLFYVRPKIGMPFVVYVE